MKFHPVSLKSETMKHFIAHTLSRWGDLWWSSRAVERGLVYWLQLSTRWWCLANWGWSACMHMLRRGANGVTQLLSLWLQNSALSPIDKHTSFVWGFCPLPTKRSMSKPARWHLSPKFYLRWAVFPNPLLLRSLWLGPTPPFWERVSPNNGWVLDCPWVCSCDHAVVEAQRL